MLYQYFTLRNTIEILPYTLGVLYITFYQHPSPTLSSSALVNPPKLRTFDRETNPFDPYRQG